ncbi:MULTISPECIES: TolC family outer membrane protein [Kosakonia]|uniref:TolC family outer membrane protein n=1 Tax=Kosakonia TaxID=1330547 RepID=UPI00201DD112|nr:MULTISPECIES: TolC family outer membrane protein [Kosakonia]MCL6742425.1 TolC family outer membrane protein [Kosakonia sp. R1.Fl]MDZ7323335.1 TolC family outer membrane protein [Kosakonia sacchari]
MLSRKPLLWGISLPLLLSTGAHATTLEQAVKEAILWHPEVSASINRRYSADEDLRAAKGGYLPSLDVTAGTGWEQSDNSTTRAAGDHLRNLHRSESSITVTQNLFSGFATRNEVARQTATVNSRAWTVLDTSESTALQAIQYYLDVLMRRQLVTLAEENLKNHQRVFDQITLRTEQGVGRQADYEQAEARLAQARNNLLTEQTNLDDSLANYQSMTGKEADDLTLPAKFKVPASLEEARQSMLKNSPLLKQAAADVEATRQQYEAAKSRFYPSVSVEVGRTMDNNIDGTRGHNQEWQAMLRMRYNLYNGGSDSATLSSYAYKMREAQDVRNNALRQLNEELRLAWNALQNAQKQVPIAKDYADRSVTVRSAYQEQFSLGDRSLLDMLDSENEVFTAQQRYVEMQFTEMFSTYRINARTGELLKALNIQPPSSAQPLDDTSTSKVELPELK